MFTNSVISFGISASKKRKNAVLLTNVAWLESLERCRQSIGLESVQYEYWSYPSPSPEVSIWIRNNKSVVFFLSDGFLKVATESQVVTMMESLNAGNFQEIRGKNRQKSFSLMISQFKGESRRYRFWILSFFLYPLERFLKIAKI